MARYYEENALIEFVKQYTPTIEGETTLECVERAICNAPTADVVPKSEVATEIIKDLVAFVDEKERIVQRYWGTAYYVNSDDLTDFIADLKKKYTEEKK